MAITHMNLSFTLLEIKQFWKKMGKGEKNPRTSLLSVFRCRVLLQLGFFLLVFFVCFFFKPVATPIFQPEIQKDLFQL